MQGSAAMKQPIRWKWLDFSPLCGSVSNFTKWWRAKIKPSDLKCPRDLVFKNSTWKINTYRGFQVVITNTLFYCGSSTTTSGNRMQRSICYWPWKGMKKTKKEENHLVWNISCCSQVISRWCWSWNLNLVNHLASRYLILMLVCCRGK